MKRSSLSGIGCDEFLRFSAAEFALVGSNADAYKQSFAFGRKRTMPTTVTGASSTCYTAPVIAETTS
jgi:hypothetical protein